MSGYAEGAVDTLILGKELNIILFDQRDMDAAIIRGSGSKNVLKLELRKAAEEGAIYFPTEGELVTASKTQSVEIDLLRFDQTTGSVVATRPVEPAKADLLIVCEGDSDRIVIATLVERILAAAGSSRSIKILIAMGKMTILRVANAVWNTFHSESKVLIVTDGDNDPAGTATMLGNGREFGDWVAAIPNPSIESWLGLDLETLRRLGKSRIEVSRSAAETLDIDALRQRDDQFEKFFAVILDG